MRVSVSQLRRIIIEAVEGRPGRTDERILCVIPRSTHLTILPVLGQREQVRVVYSGNGKPQEKILYNWQVFRDGTSGIIDPNVVMYAFEVPDAPGLVYVEIDAGPPEDVGGFTMKRAHVSIPASDETLH